MAALREENGNQNFVNKERMKNDKKSIKKGLIGIGTLIGVAAITYLIYKYQKDKNVKKVLITDTNDVVTITTSGGGTTSTTLPSFVIKDMWLNGSNYTNYISLNDALDKNFENSGFTNRESVLFASAMNNSVKAYSNSEGTVLYPSGSYYFSATGEMLSITSDGIMTFSSDILKPNNLIPITITETY
jgi:hypothetical protein